MPGENHTSHVSHSQKVDRTTLKNLQHGKVRILRKPNSTTGNSGKAASSAGIATALFGNTTSGGYHRYNPGGHDENANSVKECILPELRLVQPLINNSLQAAEGHRSEATANAQPQILKRAVRLDAERPQQPSTRRIVAPTSWAQAREQRGYGGTQRGRERRGYRGRGQSGRAVKGSLRSHQELPNWRANLCVNAPAEEQQPQADDGSGWSVSRIPLHRRTARPPEDHEFFPLRPGFRRVVAWLDVLEADSARGASGSDLDNEPHPKGYAEDLSILSTLSLSSRPPTPENCLHAGDPSTAARRRQVQRVLRRQDHTEIPDAGGVKLMETVYDEARRKMNFVEVEDEW
ncbi:MAG: hypothetical protein M1813_003782 [Trichoglossum hirsutum]|nr:MAG: hypothetical protein M1813_003782 [Trichoglossum hirsutum]